MDAQNSYHQGTFARRLTRVLQVAFVVLTLASIVYQFVQSNALLAVKGFMFPVFLLIPPLFRWLRLKPSWRLYCVLYAFIIFAFTYGCIYGVFKDDQIIDKVSHFLSGFVFTQLGLCLYYFIVGGPFSKQPKPTEPLARQPGPAASYALFFSLAVAVVWEIMEFFDYTVFGNDSQKHETTGVFDTMYDLMACLAASLICIAAFVLYRKRKVKLLTAAVVEEFYEENVRAK